LGLLDTRFRGCDDSGKSVQHLTPNGPLLQATL